MAQGCHSTRFNGDPGMPPRYMAMTYRWRRLLRTFSDKLAHLRYTYIVTFTSENFAPCQVGRRKSKQPLQIHAHDTDCLFFDLHFPCLVQRRSDAKQAMYRYQLLYLLIARIVAYLFWTVNPRQFYAFTLRGVGASDKLNRSLPSLGNTREDEIFRPRLLHSAFDTPATRAQAEDVLVSSIGTPLMNR